MSPNKGYSTVFPFSPNSTMMKNANYYGQYARYYVNFCFLNADYDGGKIIITRLKNYNRRVCEKESLHKEICAG